ncbi:MAG: cation acetate symporter, partial [Magnetococcales bacterium]|nr:cation acetate symporter [Magnetococcales bacterium]
LFPYKDPAIFSMTLAFVGCWFFSITDNSEGARKEKELFEAQSVRCETGIGAVGAAKH